MKKAIAIVIAVVANLVFLFTVIKGGCILINRIEKNRMSMTGEDRWFR